MGMGKGWIGVDLDGTLAQYVSGDIKRYGVYHIGSPIPEMVARVQKWLLEGRDVRIFTARIAHGDPTVTQAIRDWCEKYIGRRLEVTNVKDFHMDQLWDDRCIQVVQNTGARVGDHEPGSLPAEAANYKPV